MKNEMKGLFIIGLILTSIVGSSFAFNYANMSNNQSSYFDGVLADSKNFEYICPSKTGALVDVLDSNPCDNPVTIYNFSAANNESFLKIINDNLKEKAANNSNLSDLEVVGFNFIPINSDYFNVTIDENNIVKVTQLQDVGDNEQVMFLAVDLVIRNKTSDNLVNTDYSSFLADKNPHVPNVNKKLLNPPISLMLSDGFCGYACNVATAFCAGAIGEVELCAMLGIGGLVCVAFVAIACVTAGAGCYGLCKGIPGPF
ncbi:MAG: hypothetical protein LBR15_07935 [Methanobrevibacter sp.]|jgi:hypothetical protein|nr:hypothetical protein [Candidatus Methanovirga australis]